MMNPGSLSCLIVIAVYRAGHPKPFLHDHFLSKVVYQSFFSGKKFKSPLSYGLNFKGSFLFRKRTDKFELRQELLIRSGPWIATPRWLLWSPTNDYMVFLETGNSFEIYIDVGNKPSRGVKTIGRQHITRFSPFGRYSLERSKIVHLNNGLLPRPEPALNITKHV